MGMYCNPILRVYRPLISFGNNEMCPNQPKTKQEFQSIAIIRYKIIELTRQQNMSGLLLLSRQDLKIRLGIDTSRVPHRYF
ncbi:hypothetical protein D3C86_532720 [compost metagenome]